MVVYRQQRLLTVLHMINELEGVELPVTFLPYLIDLPIAATSDLLYYIVVNSRVFCFEQVRVFNKFPVVKVRWKGKRFFFLGKHSVGIAVP